MVPLAHAARDPADTISDFKFAPASLTIHVGDTVTWTNAGPTAHTATATDRSFDTGTLSKGASASHTFSQPGTYAYICTIHPFMHGTIVVLAAAASSTAGQSSGATGSRASNGGSGSSSGTTNGQATNSGAGQTLPLTGLDVGAGVLAGLLLLGTGLGLRLRSRGTDLDH